MKRETFVAIASALLAEADDELLREAEGLMFWRKRELRSERVQQFRPGILIEYLMPDGQTKKRGLVHHLNKFSVTVHRPDHVEGYAAEVVQVERITSFWEDREVIERWTMTCLGGTDSSLAPPTQEDLQLPETFGQHVEND